MMTAELAQRAEVLAVARQPFVTATVVRAQRPTSAHPGDTALVHADGTVDGFVGGHCAEESVRLHALRAIETAEPVLLRIEPDGGENTAVVDGAVTVHNPCLSGGALEIFLEPHLPPPRVVVVGTSPVAAALADLGSRLDLEMVSGGTVSGDELAVVVASHGTDEEEALSLALRAGVPYVGLVASARRGAAVRDALDVDDALRAQLHTPAGVDIHARTPPEVALAILAEIVSVRHERLEPVVAAEPAPAGHHCCH